MEFKIAEYPFLFTGFWELGEMVGGSGWHS
jgi:hypothetical protein